MFSVRICHLPSLTVVFASSDLGYYDRSSAGNTAVSTPHLDDLFHTGVNLQRYYGYKYCSPCRRSFVTGRWPLHLGEMNQVQDGIDLRMTTLAEKLSKASYKNVLIGKTHWGVATTHHLPAYRGWHEHIGYLGGGEAYWSGHECKNETTNCDDFSQQLDFWQDKSPAESALLGQYSTTLFTSLAVDVLRNSSSLGADERLWLHLNYQAVHNPQTSPPGEPHCADDTTLVFRQVLEKMDEGLGNLSAVLHSGGASGGVAWEETLVILVSDNGGASHGNNYPYRAGKYSPFEGGVRLMAVISGGALPSALVGTNFPGMIHVSDWYGKNNGSF